MTDETSTAALADILNKGEKTASTWSFNYLDGKTLDAGSMTVPGRIDTPEGHKFSALNMIRHDLQFALECLTDAKKLGLPDSENRTLKALIFAGVTSYARPFKTSVREFKLTENEFSSLGDFSAELHNYLIALRDKHIAHSVNEFERCEASTVMVGTPDQKSWRVAGIGFTFLNAIGLSAALLDKAIGQISKMLPIVDKAIDESRTKLYKEQTELFAKNSNWKPAPLTRFPNRDNVAKRRS